MIPNDSFLSRIPRALDLQQRLALEGASWSINTILWSFQKLEAESTNPPAGDDRPKLQSLFAYCWMIIDQGHMLRMLLKQLPLEPGKVLSFVEKYEHITLMRNAMDHLHGSLGNLSKVKEARSPIFGSLSYCLFTDEDFEIAADGSRAPVGCHVVTLMAGSFSLNNHAMQINNPTGIDIKIPVGLFRFEAFEKIVDLSQLANDLEALIEHFNTHTASRIEQRICEEATAKGLDPDKVLAERVGGGLQITMKIRFGADQ